MTDSPLTPLGHDRSGQHSAPAERWGGFDDTAATVPDTAALGTVTVTVQLGFRVAAEQEREIVPALLRAALQLSDTAEIELLHVNTARNEIGPITKRSSNSR